jgi:hypothetical protein
VVSGLEGCRGKLVFGFTSSFIDWEKIFWMKIGGESFVLLNCDIRNWSDGIYSELIRKLKDVPVKNLTLTNNFSGYDCISIEE